MNYKGGVGKTTLTANMAAELANLGKNVLLIDLDPQSNLTFSFVSLDEWREYDDSGTTIKHWYDEFLDHHTDGSLKNLVITPSKINGQLTSHHSKGKVDMICSHLELINVDMELSSRLGGNTDRIIRNNYLKVLTRLRHKLQEVQSDYDVVLIDCPPNFNLVTQNAMVASDYYIVPAKADYLSTLGIDTLLRHVNELKQKYNHYCEEIEGTDWKSISPKMLGVVFTMVSYYSEQPISVQKDFMARVKREDYPTFRYRLRENKSLFANAPESGVPVVLKQGTGQQRVIQKELQNLVNEMIERTNLKGDGG